MSQITSQTISRGEVREIINTKGDTLILMHLDDARTILSDLLEYEIADSLLLAYKEKDSLCQEIIEMQKDIFIKLSIKSDNQQSIIENFEDILSNNKKEIKKQKRLKIVGFIGSILLPIITLIALT